MFDPACYCAAACFSAIKSILAALDSDIITLQEIAIGCDCSDSRDTGAMMLKNFWETSELCILRCMRKNERCEERP
jgi:hypothetical protein